MSEQPPWDINKPAMTAFIREDECIGCTKCLPDCPTDAILGGAKMMHTVITDVCTGCELCIPTCPVDCIEIRPTTPHTLEQHHTWTQRYEKHNQRIARNKQKQTETALLDKLSSVDARKQYIEAALKRQQESQS